MRKRAKVDANHVAITTALRRVGATVQSLANVGGGCPDLLVAKAGKVYLLEVKDGTRKPCERKLTPDEARWHATWAAPVYVVESVEQALAVVR